MKIIRYSKASVENYGVLRDNKIHELSGDIFTEFSESGRSFLFGEVDLLPPVDPSKIVAVGLNYKEHAKELNLPLPTEPLIFLKPKSAIIADGKNIIYPDMSSRVDYEGELGVVIKKRAKNVLTSDAKDYILGYTCVNDVTARDLQFKDGQFTRAKSFDTFCPVGPCIQTELDPKNAKLKTYVNQELRQSTCTSDMIFDMFYIVSFISQIMTLEAGDLIITGTPKGVGSLNRGDEITVEIDTIGRLTNKIV